jgi:integrase
MQPTTLRSYLDVLLSERDVTRHYANSLRRHIDAFGDYLKRPATLDDLSSHTVNAFVSHLQETSGWMPKTIKSYQAAIILAWREAFDREDVQTPPWRLKRIKVPKRVVQAWTLAELRAILAACKWLRGDVPGTQIWKRDYFRAYIPLAYYTGLRRCDLMNHAKRADLRDGVLTVVESKNPDKVLARQVPESIVASLQLVWAQSEDSEYLLPWHGKVRRFYGSFKVLVQKAGVTPGGPHKLRKSAGSLAHAVNGNGPALLGHDVEATFHKHYHDRSITRQTPELPPEL